MPSYISNQFGACYHAICSPYLNPSVPATEIFKERSVHGNSKCAGFVFNKASLWDDHPVQYLLSLTAKFMGPTWGSPRPDRTQVGSMLATWTLLSGISLWLEIQQNAIYLSQMNIAWHICKTLLTKGLLLSRHWLSVACNTNMARNFYILHSLVNCFYFCSKILQPSFSLYLLIP